MKSEAVNCHFYYHAQKASSHDNPRPSFERVAAAPAQAEVAHPTEKDKPVEFKVVKDPPPVTASHPPAPVDNTAAVNKAAPWSGSHNSMVWTKTALTVIRKRKKSLDQARDVETFCRGYKKASEKQQEICWIRIIGGIMKYESSFRAGGKMRENTGEWSVGLLAMSPSQCPNAPSVEALRDPKRNVVCGINRLADLIGQSGWISGPGNRGAAKNWSTLRGRYPVRLANYGVRTVMVGHKSEVIKIAMGYSTSR